MSIFVVICFALAAVLAALAAFYRSPSPPPVHLLSLSVMFLCLAFLLQSLVGVTG